MQIYFLSESTEPPKYFRVKHDQFYIHHYADTRAKKQALEEMLSF